MQDYDLVVVGGGMTGLALVAGLAGSRKKIAIIETALEAPQWQAEVFDHRVSALSEASRALLDQLGAWEKMQARRVNPYQAMHVWDQAGTGEVSFAAHQAEVPHLGYLVENSVTHLGLLEQVEQQQNVTWYRGYQLTALEPGPQPRLTLESTQQTQTEPLVLSTALVVGADGAHSSVRRLADFATREWSYQHHALVTSVRTRLPHQDTAWQRFASSGPLAFLPLNKDGDRHWCSIVWSTSPEEAKILLELDAKTFHQRLGAAFEWRLGEIEQSEARAVLPLRQRHAKHYVQPGVALIGDAAHTIHPLAGQGVNLGFLDVLALTQVLVQAEAAQEAWGDLRVLERYQRQRQPDNLAMMALMETFKRLFASSSLPTLLLRNLGMKWVNSQDWMKRHLVAQALGYRPFSPS